MTRTEENIKTMKEVCRLTYIPGWDSNEETVEKVRELAVSIGGKPIEKTALQQQGSKEVTNKM